MTATPSVVVTDFLDNSLATERAVLDGVAEIAALGARCEEDLVGRIEEADALIVYHEVSLTRRTIERLARCRLIVRGGVGFDNVDGVFARQRGIALANVPDYGSEEVADSALGMLLSLARGIQGCNSRLRADSSDLWSYRLAAPLVRLRGRVLGIVGLGRIGTAMALRAKTLGMEVLFYDPYKDDGYDRALGVRRAGSLAEVLEESLAVSLHCPLTEETHHMIDAAAMARLGPGAYLINTARGAVVDTAAVPAAIAAGRLAGAGIDVLPQEPPVEDDPLLLAWRDPAHPAHHRLLVNPHVAFYCEEGLEDVRRKAAEACRRVLLGKPPRNVVN